MQSLRTLSGVACGVLGFDCVPPGEPGNGLQDPHLGPIVFVRVWEWQAVPAAGACLGEAGLCGWRPWAVCRL